MRSKPLPRDFHLGEWLVQPSLDRLSRDGRTVYLRAKLMDVLVHLAEHAGEVRAKDDIIAAVWEQRFLAESVLTRSITELRQALGDDLGAPRYIETVTKRGYRLVAPVSGVGPERRAPGTGRSAFVVSYAGGRTLLPKGESVIGRAPDAAVHIDSMSVSRHHARLVVEDGRVRLDDLGSKNGTMVNGVAVRGSVELGDGDTIRIGATTLRVHAVGLQGTTETSPDGGSAGASRGPKDAG